MIVIMIIVIVLIGVAYADYCLIDNTAHFGRCYGKVAEAEQKLSAAPKAGASETLAPAEVEPIEALGAPANAGSVNPTPGEARGTRVLPPRNPAPAWLRLGLEPVLELHEERTGTTG